MEKSISNRFYFDYNATSPLSNKVIDFLRSGDFLFGNPASLHSTGKHAKKFINETSQFLFSTFGLDQKNFELIYHSGATEAINTIFKGNALVDFKNKKKSLFVFSAVDHQAVMSLKEDLETLSHSILIFDVDKNGEFNVDSLIEKINKIKSNYSNIYLNFTYVNNETGVVWPLSLAEKIKAETGAFVYVDAVQLVGKIEYWKDLSHNLDGYFFSAHKFGAFKNIGFTFLKIGSPYHSLLTGGNQQKSLRSGTENALGIYSIKLALADIIERFDFNESREAKLFLEQNIKNILGPKGLIVAEQAKLKNVNTIFFIVFGEKAESLSMKFDMNKMDVSTGSACSSGIIKENRVLIAMGYSLEDSRSCIRLSFSPFINQMDASNYLEAIKSVIKR